MKRTLREAGPSPDGVGIADSPFLTVSEAARFCRFDATAHDPEHAFRCWAGAKRSRRFDAGACCCLSARPFSRDAESLMANTNPSWLAGKIRELGELLRRLPNARQCAFRDALDALRAPENDDRQATKTTPGQAIDRAPEPRCVRFGAWDRLSPMLSFAAGIRHTRNAWHRVWPVLRKAWPAFLVIAGPAAAFLLGWLCSSNRANQIRFAGTVSPGRTLSDERRSPVMKWLRGIPAGQGN